MLPPNRVGTLLSRPYRMPSSSKRPLTRYCSGNQLKLTCCFTIIIINYSVLAASALWIGWGWWPAPLRLLGDPLPGRTGESCQGTVRSPYQDEEGRRGCRDPHHWQGARGKIVRWNEESKGCVRSFITIRLLYFDFPEHREVRPS